MRCSRGLEIRITVLIWLFLEKGQKNRYNFDDH